MVGAAGFEPATVGLEIRCSIRLSYAPAFVFNTWQEFLSTGRRLSTDFTLIGSAAFNAAVSMRCIAVLATGSGSRNGQGLINALVGKD